MMKQCEWSNCTHGWAQWLLEYRSKERRFLCNAHYLELLERHSQDKTLEEPIKRQFIGAAFDGVKAS